MSTLLSTIELVAFGVAASFAMGLLVVWIDHRYIECDNAARRRP
jgi:hypothetical protein